MRSRIQLLFKSPFVRNTGKIATGTALAQLITLGTMPFLTRLYGPEAFGIYGVMMAIVAPLTVIANGRYDLAIVLPKSDAAAASLLRLTFRLAIIISLVVGLLVFLGRHAIAASFDNPSFEYLFWFVPLFVLFNAWNESQANWVLRKKEFGHLTKSAPLAATAAGGLAIGLGLFFGTPASLLIGNLANPLTSLIYLRACSRVALRAIGPLQGTARVAGEYREFPIYRVPQDILNALSQSVIGMLLAYYFSPAMMAQYWLAHRVVAAPLGLISGAVGHVFYQRSAALKNEDKDLYPELKQKTLGLAIVSIPLFTVGAIAVPYIFPLLFGPEWLDAGAAASWITLWIGTMFINSPSVKALDVYRLQKFKLIYGIFVLVLRVTVVVIFAQQGNFLHTVAAFCIAGAFVNIVLIAATLAYSKKLGARFQ